MIIIMKSEDEDARLAQRSLLLGHAVSTTMLSSLANCYFLVPFSSHFSVTFIAIMSFHVSMTRRFLFIFILTLLSTLTSCRKSSNDNNQPQRSLSEVLSSPDKFFYIYEWPSYLDDVWPPENATLHVKSGYDHGFRPNRGAGRAIAPEWGLFQTWQFSLYRNLMARLRTSTRRTRDPSKAVAFIIPFDAGVHSYIDHEDGHPRLAAPHGRYVGMSNCAFVLRNISSYVIYTI